MFVYLDLDSAGIEHYILASKVLVKLQLWGFMLWLILQRLQCKEKLFYSIKESDSEKQRNPTNGTITTNGIFKPFILTWSDILAERMVPTMV